MQKIEDMTEGAAPADEKEKGGGAPEEQLIKMFFKSLDKELLTKEEERRLAYLAKSGDEKARDELIRKNILLVISIAKKHQGLGLSFLDLIQEGTLGLMRAVDKFDPGKGYKLSTYASYWIRQTIWRALWNQGKIVRIPAHAQERLSQCRRASDKIRQRQCREPKPSEIAKLTSMEQEKVHYLLSLDVHSLSLNAPVAGDEFSDYEFQDFLEDATQFNPLETLMAKRELHQRVRRFNNILARLNPPPRLVKEVFYLTFWEGEKLQKIGDRVGLTRERIRQMKAQALKKMLKTQEWEIRKFVESIRQLEDLTGEKAQIQLYM
ncbi:RNA polymerase sigma factor RpoD/SigA [Candidatus Azambacteria bacterium]|nr:RNA polymerase sigma factor RpoD/SigA [Candidatus Azambacteria bacterium]MBI3685545.1 RNA polymerase sigma factor RpoD/SigA [Candidatus Azambacteria bacterium]